MVQRGKMFQKQLCLSMLRHLKTSFSEAGQLPILQIKKLKNIDIYLITYLSVYSPILLERIKNGITCSESQLNYLNIHKAVV